jgi:hypothetical protein
MISATMWSLLTGLKDQISTEVSSGGTLPQIRQVKRGVLAPRAPFPQIALTPVSETVTRLSSSRVATISKAIEVLLYWRDLKGRRAVQDMEEHVDALRAVIEAKRQLPNVGVPRAMDAIFEGIDYAEEEVSDSVFHTARIPVAYINKEVLPDPTITEAMVLDPGLRAVANRIYVNMKADPALSKIREFHDSGFGPFNLFPAISIEVANEFTEAQYAGADELSQEIVANLMCPILKRADTELSTHLNFIEKMKIRLWTDINLAGMAQAVVATVNHGTTIQSRRILYISEILSTITARLNVTPA